MHWLLIVPILILQSVFNTGLAMIMARIGAKTTDMAQLMPFVIRTWMYLSGVFWAVSTFTAKAPHWAAVMLNMNPALIFNDLMRYAMMTTVPASILPAHVWLITLGWALLFGLGGYVSSGCPRRSTAVDDITVGEEQIVGEERVVVLTPEQIERERLLEQERQDRAAKQAKFGRIPTVIVDDIHIVYKIYGAGVGKGSRPPRCRGSSAAAPPRRDRGARGQGHQLHRVQGRGDRPDRLQRLGQVDHPVGRRRPAAGGVAAIYTDGQPSLLGVNAALMNDLTGERNVVLGCLAMGMSKAEVKERYQGIVDFSGIQERGDFVSCRCGRTPPVWPPGCGSPSPRPRPTTCC